MLPTPSTSVSDSHRTPSQVQPSSCPAGQEEALEAGLNRKQMSQTLASDKFLLAKLDELFGGVEDLDERVRLISTAVEHLQQMRTRITQAE